MIRIYLDWNVMSQMKNGFHEELYKIISNKEQFLIIFSTSYISDIYSSYSDNEYQQELINNDLEYISSLTDNYCAFNNGKDVIIDLNNPKTMFDQKVDETDILTDFNLDKLLSSFGGTDDETNDLIKKGIETLRNLPIESIFKDPLDDPISRSQLEKLFPGLEHNLTFEGLVNSGLNMFRGLSDKEDYKDLRIVLQNGLGINRDKMFDKNVPYASIEQTYSKHGIELPLNGENKKHAPKWFNEITDNYLLLDMHGYQEDEIVVKNRNKATFRNTVDDAFHCAFASMCDFYIINDKRSYKKSREVFNKLNLNTRILRPNEFLEFYKMYLLYDLIEEHLFIAYDIFANSEYKQNESDTDILRSYYFNYFLFDYFTRGHILINKSSTDVQIFLSKDKPTNHKFIFRCEIEKLLEKLSSIFGSDRENKGAFREEEIVTDNNWDGRSWLYNNSIYRLVLCNGWLQLYIDVLTE